MDSTKLIKSLANKSSILTPHIDLYQSKGKFPDEWTIKIYNRREEDQLFHPSSDCLTPVKELYLQKTGQAKHESITPALRRAFDIGTMWHGYVENILLDMGFVEPENVEKSHLKEIKTKDGEAKARGTGDLVNVKIPGHGKWLVDIKTMNKRSFDNPPDYLMQKYVAQINIYADFFELDQLMILAINKDSPHDFKEIIVKRDNDLIEIIYDKWVLVSNCIKMGTEPLV